MMNHRHLAGLTAALAVLFAACTGSGGIGPPASVTSAPPPTTEPAAVALPEDGSIDAGRYRIGSGPALVVTVPAGWVSTGTGIRKNLDDPTEVALETWTGDIQVFTDACRSEGAEEAVGPTAADLLAALRAQENSEISSPVDAAVGGLTGMRLEIAAPAGLDTAECSIGSLQIWVAGGVNYLAGVGLADSPAATVYVVDAPGGRLTFGVGHQPGATAADIAELDAIVASIEIEE